MPVTACCATRSRCRTPTMRPLQFAPYTHPPPAATGLKMPNACASARASTAQNWLLLLTIASRRVPLACRWLRPKSADWVPVAETFNWRCRHERPADHADLDGGQDARHP